MQVAEILDDGRALSAPRPGRTRAARTGILIVVAAAVGLVAGQAWAQRGADSDASSQVRLRAVLTSTQLVQDLGEGPRVKLVGSLVNAGPRALRVAPAGGDPTATVSPRGLAPADSTTFTFVAPFLCRGTVTAPVRDLELLATTEDGSEHRVVVSLQGDQALADLSLVCLARRTP